MAHSPTNIHLSAPHASTGPVPVIEDEESIKSLFQRLLADGKDFVRAEIDLYKTKAVITGQELGMAAGLGVGAIILANAALIALLVGLIMTLDRAGAGPGGATAIVVLITLAIAGVLGFVAYGQFKKALGAKPDHSKETQHRKGASYG